MTNIKPSEEDLKIFCSVVFSHLSGLCALRSFPEKGNKDSRSVPNTWVPADEELLPKMLDFATRASSAQGACYVIPGSVLEVGKAGSADVAEMQALLIDIDDGNTEEILKEMSCVIGEPSLVVESGGVTKEGSTKLHVYWKLTEPASGDDLKTLLELRHKIALAFGGDTHFKSAHQPIRVAGSVYHKNGESKPVKVRSYDPVEYELGALTDILSYITSQNDKTSSGEFKTLNKATVENEIIHNKAPSNNIISFVKKPSIDNVFTSKAYEGASGEATRFANLQRVIGFWLRRHHEGMVSQENAMEEIYSYNDANVVPSWPRSRIDELTRGLWKKHVKEHGEATSKDKDDSSITPIDIEKWGNSPPIRKWIIEDWLPRGYVTAIYGDGGVGKSLLTQQLITALSTGKRFLGKDLKPCKVYALMCEDDPDELWRRQVAINRYYDINMGDLKNFRLVSRVGYNNLLMNFNSSDSGQLTAFYHNLSEDISKHNPDLIVLDTVADLFAGNENNRPQVRQFIQTACGGLARSTGSAVLLCAHPSESGLQKGTGSGGSTAWNNTVRSRWYLKKPEAGELTDNHRIISKVKSNYSSCGDEEYLLWEDGVFIEVDSRGVSIPITRKGALAKNASERDRRLDRILKLLISEAIMGRIYTMNQFAEKFEDNKDNHHGFGSKRSINERLSIAATQGIIRFFNNPESYGVNVAKSGKYYMWVDAMSLPKNNIIVNKNEQGKGFILVTPTHYKCEYSGSLSIERCENYDT